MLAPAGLGVHERRLGLVRLGNVRLFERCGSMLPKNVNLSEVRV